MSISDLNLIDGFWISLKDAMKYLMSTCGVSLDQMALDDFSLGRSQTRDRGDTMIAFFSPSRYFRKDRRYTIMRTSKWDVKSFRSCFEL